MTGFAPMTPLRQIGAILACAGLAGFASAVLHPFAPAWFPAKEGPTSRWSILPEEARQLASKADLLWIDARSREEYEVGHLPGALLLNPDEWGELMFEHQFALQEAFSRPIVVYAEPADPVRAADIAQRLRELLGLDPVYVLEGSWTSLAE